MLHFTNFGLGLCDCLYTSTPQMSHCSKGVSTSPSPPTKDSTILQVGIVMANTYSNRLLEMLHAYLKAKNLDAVVC